MLSNFQDLGLDDKFEEFYHLPDKKVYQDYFETIAYPISLSMIEERVKNDFYRRYESFVWDLQLLYNNAYSYNRPNSEIVKNAVIIKRLLTNLKSRRYKRQNKTRIATIMTSNSDDSTTTTEEIEESKTRIRKRSKRLNIYRNS